MTEHEKRLTEVLRKFQWEDLSGEEYCIACEERKVDGCSPECEIEIVLKQEFPETMTKIEGSNMKKQCQNPAIWLFRVDTLLKDMPLCGVHKRSFKHLEHKSGVTFLQIEKAEGAVCAGEVLSEAQAEITP